MKREIAHLVRTEHILHDFLYQTASKINLNYHLIEQEIYKQLIISPNHVIINKKLGKIQINFLSFHLFVPIIQRSSSLY